MTGRWIRYARGHWADPLYRQSYLMLASTAVSAGTGLLFWVVAARRAQPEALGVAAGLVAAIAFLSYLTSFALPYAMLRFGGSTRPISGMTNASLVFSSATSLAAAAVFALVAPLSSPDLAGLLDRPGEVVLFGLAGMGAATSVLLDNLLAARRRAGTVLARNTVAGVLKLVPLALPGAGDPRVLYLAASLPALVTAVAVLALLPRVVPGYRLGALRVDGLTRDAASFAVRTFPASLLSGAPQFALPMVAVFLLTPRDNAFFYVAWSIAQIAYLIPTVVANIALSQGGASPDPTLIRRSRRFSLILLAPACAVGVLLTTFVLGFYGADYVEGASVPLRLLLLAVLPWVVVIIAQTQLRLEHRFVAVTTLTGFLCLTSLGLPVALAPGFHLPGMAAGWLVSVLAAALLAWRLTARPHPVAAPERSADHVDGRTR